LNQWDVLIGNGHEERWSRPKVVEVQQQEKGFIAKAKSKQNGSAGIVDPQQYVLFLIDRLVALGSANQRAIQMSVVAYKVDSTR